LASKLFQADIRVIGGGGALSLGPGFANDEGLAAKGGGRVHWSSVDAIRCIETRPGNASTGALAGGAIGMLGGPPVAAVAAIGGAMTALATGARHLYAIRLNTGADVLFEISAWKSKQMEKAFKNGKVAIASGKMKIFPSIADLRSLMKPKRGSDS
jgi:hypothetical protein